MRKFALIGPESTGVVVTPPIDQTCRMFNVQHLVIKDVLDEPLGNISRIERLADGDAVVNMIVMAENAPGPALRPRNRRLGNLPIKVLAIQFCKHSIKIVNLTLRG